MFVSKDDKTKYIPNPFSDQTAITVMPLFEAYVTNHVPSFKHVSPIEVVWV